MTKDIISEEFQYFTISPLRLVRSDKTSRDSASASSGLVFSLVNATLQSEIILFLWCVHDLNPIIQKFLKKCSPFKKSHKSERNSSSNLLSNVILYWKKR